MPTWMVVEDEPDIYDVLLAMFEIWGIEGVAFVDGAEAVAWIDDVDQGRVRGELPELAILDIRLPEVSGPEVGARLRASSVLNDIAIVLITAYRLSPDEEEAVLAQAQADLLMYKPLPGMAELRTTMDDVISQHSKPVMESTSSANPGAGKADNSGKPGTARPAGNSARKHSNGTAADARPAPEKDSSDKSGHTPPTN